MPGSADPPPRENGEPSPTAGPFIRLEGVSLSYGDLPAVTDIHLSIGRGDIFGLIGSDGAGKSSLLRMIAAMIPPTTGRILLGGYDTRTGRRAVKRMIGYMPQRFGLYQDLTVGENMDFFLDIFGVSGEERKKRKDRFLRFSNLDPFIDRLAANLSGGMKQKLGLACVLVHHPEILVLDEPTNGVDPVSRQEFWEILFQMKREGMTVLVSTAYLDEGEKCDALALMHRGAFLAVGTPGDIRGAFPNLEEAMIERIEKTDRELAHDRFQY
jgi:ABC-2 type transport system ATP-binding protein